MKTLVYSTSSLSFVTAEIFNFKIKIIKHLKTQNRILAFDFKTSFY